MAEDWPDPREATDAAEFVAAMRTLRARTDLSYRVLERRAAKAGTPLPSSTISGALSRDTLPRAELVAAFVRACGADDETVERWLAARADLATVDQASEPDAVEEPSGAEEVQNPEAPRTRSRLLWPVIGVAVVAVLVVGGLIVFNDSPPEQPVAAPSSAASSPSLAPSAPTTVPAAANAGLDGPPTGRSRVRLAHTGLCVGEGPEKFVQEERIVLGQQDCAKASPPMSVEAVEGGYRLLLHSPEHGEGCATVDYGGTAASTLLAGDHCEPGRTDQRFLFEPVTAPAKGYLLKSAAGARWCVGVYKGSSEVGVQLIQDPCDGTAAQVFLVERADAS